MCFWLAGVCGAQPQLQPHLQALRCDVAAVRSQAATTLGRSGARSAVPGLVAALGDADPGVRRESAKALGAIKDAAAVPPLVKALADSDANVRLYAAYALGEIKDPRSVDALLQAFEEEEWAVRDQVLWALGEIGGVHGVGEEIAERVAATLRNPHTSRDEVVWLLRRLDREPAVQQVAALLSEGDPAVRSRALDVLGHLGSTAATEAIVAGLDDVQAAVRRSAIAAVLRLGDRQALQPLKALAARESEPTLRRAAERAVAELLRHEALAAHWSFDDGDPALARDVGGRGVHGQIRGCQPVDGKRGKALRFGPGSYVELGRPAELPIANQPLTVMAWIHSEADQGVVVARGGAYCGYSLYVKEGVAKFGIQREKGGPGYLAAGAARVTDRWVHLAGVIRADRIELYVDGRLAATRETPGFIPGNCGQGMEIGHSLGTSPAEIRDHFQGIIDEVKVFEAALSASEIVQQIQRGESSDGSQQIPASER